MFHPRTRFNVLATRIWNVVFENTRPSSFGRGFTHGEKRFTYGPERNVQHVKYSSDATESHTLNDVVVIRRPEVGGNISKRDKTKTLLNILSSLKESKKAVYGALDAWVAWEQNFPLAPLRQTLTMLEKQHQWHRIVQVIKWMLSKGQGTTMGTYEQLIRALDKDERAKEAHIFWEQRIRHDLHSVPWQLCELMISIYYRNNMLEHGVKFVQKLVLHSAHGAHFHPNREHKAFCVECGIPYHLNSAFHQNGGTLRCPFCLCTHKPRLVSGMQHTIPGKPGMLFKDLEAFGRKPPNGSIIRKIADSYELLGLFDEQKKVLEKYDVLVSELSKVSSKRRGKCSTAKNKKNV